MTLLLRYKVPRQLKILRENVHRKLKRTNNARKLIEEIYKYLICECTGGLSGHLVSIQFNIQI